MHCNREYMHGLLHTNLCIMQSVTLVHACMDICTPHEMVARYTALFNIDQYNIMLKHIARQLQKLYRTCMSCMMWV